MKNLFWVFLVVLTGCSSAGDYPCLFIVPDSGIDTETEVADAGGDSSVDADSDSDTDTDSDSDTESDAGTGLVCDSGACCAGGEIAVEGTECISDVLPENMDEGFDPATWVPMQFRCPEPAVCGSGEERRLGHTACDGSSSSCRLDNFVWESWETTLTESELDTVCNPLSTDGAVVWGFSSSSGFGRSRYYCLSFGCDAGECVTGKEVGSGECDYGECGDYCSDDLYSAFNCGGVCGNSCFEQGGASCDPSDAGPVCQCGDNPACSEGNRCVWSDVIEEFTCIPE